MKTILIADDEKLERNGIRFLIGKSAYEFRIFEASNGLEALSILKNEEIDILLCDVKMPRMTGLELIHKIRPLYPALQIVIFSGYNDFSYAREAMQNGVLDYILKPVDPKEFEKVLAKAAANLESSATQEKKAIEQMDFLRQYIVAGFLYGEQAEKLRHAAQWSEFDFVCLDQYAYMVLVETRNSFFEMEDEQFVEKLRHTLRTEVFYLNLSASQAVLFIGRPGPEPQQLGTGIYQFFKTVFQVEVYVAVSCRMMDHHEMPSCFDCLEQLLEEQFYTPHVHIRLMGSSEESSESREIADAELLRQMTEDIRHKDILHLKKHYRTIMQRYGADKQFSEMYVKFVFSNILKEIYEAMGTPDEKRLAKEVERLYRCRRIDDVMKVVQAAIEQYAKSLEDGEDGYRKDVRVVKNYICGHYDEDLNTEVLAQKVYLSPGYLSFVFKQETGINLNRFIRQYRMEKAKQLLGDSNMKISQIAQRVGFSNNSYFCRSFREYFGSSPESFRKGAMSNEKPDSAV